MSEPSSFDEFWPIYLKAHSSPETRVLHFLGTAAAAGCVLAFAKTRKPGWLLAALAAGYGPSWAGHALVEHNRPATLTHPIWSLRADVKMLEMAAAGTLDAELARLGISKPRPVPLVAE
ncbi:MAG: DUF962 domain-containing protein [Hyphomicrobiaceae bacterium]|nr:DUF962 domain-containing protein [Hyphomicrobiaceae bacterium]